MNPFVEWNDSTLERARRGVSQRVREREIEGDREKIEEAKSEGEREKEDMKRSCRRVSLSANAMSCS